MMMNNKTLIKEVDELKDVLSRAMPKYRLFGYACGPVFVW